MEAAGANSGAPPPSREPISPAPRRRTLATRPRVLSAPVLDRPAWLYSFCAPCFCFHGSGLTAFSATESEMASVFGDASRSRRSVLLPPEPRCNSVKGFLVWRLFCLRCGVAEQTFILFDEEDARRRVPLRFCCEGFFGEEGNMARSFWTMCIVDVLTCGCPCGYCYHGLGTTLYAWRLRYLVRCRYRVKGKGISDCLSVLCCPLCAVEQQGREMAAHGLYERRRIRHVMV